MRINDPEGYLESLRKLERNVYMLGEMCANTVDHPVKAQHQCGCRDVQRGQRARSGGTPLHEVSPERQ